MSEKGTQIFITKIPYDFREDNLKDLFKKYGEINNINLKKGYGFITYNNYDDAMGAIKDMNDYKIDDRKRLVVEKAGQRERRQRGPNKEDKCFNCGRRGHWASDCRRRSYDRSPDRRYRRRSSSRSYERRRYRDYNTKRYRDDSRDRYRDRDYYRNNRYRDNYRRRDSRDYSRDSRRNDSYHKRDSSKRNRRSYSKEDNKIINEPINENKEVIQSETRKSNHQNQKDNQRSISKSSKSSNYSQSSKSSE